MSTVFYNHFERMVSFVSKWNSSDRSPSRTTKMLVVTVSFLILVLVVVIILRFIPRSADVIADNNTPASSTENTQPQSLQNPKDPANQGDPAPSSETESIPTDSGSVSTSTLPKPSAITPQYNPGNDFVSFIESLGYGYGIDQYFVENNLSEYMYFYRQNENGATAYALLFHWMSGRYWVSGNQNGLMCTVVGTCYSKNAEWDNIVWVDPSQVYVVAPEHIKVAMAELLIALGSDGSEFGQDNIDQLSAIVRKCDKYDITVYMEDENDRPVEQFHEGTGNIEAPT